MPPLAQQQEQPQQEQPQAQDWLAEKEEAPLALSTALAARTALAGEPRLALEAALDEQSRSSAYLQSSSSSRGRCLARPALLAAAFFWASLQRQTTLSLALATTQRPC